MKLAIRPFAGNDDEFVARLSSSAFGEYARDAGAATLFMAEHSLTLVAERGGEKVGFAVIRVEPGALSELLAIAVVEHERGRRVGRALLAEAEQRARARGATGVTLHTAEANLAALELFSKSGFRIRQRLPRFYRGMFDAFEMMKRF